MITLLPPATKSSAAATDVSEVDFPPGPQGVFVPVTVCGRSLKSSDIQQLHVFLV